MILREGTQTKPLSGAGRGLLLSGMRVALDAWRAESRPLTMAGGRFADEAPGKSALELDGLVALPGLINAHDHLELALFPRLGGRRYQNAREWAEDIYRPEESPVREHLRVPKRDRLIWGGLRNLLGGVTTVCHHNPYDPQVFGAGFPVRVVRDFGWAHSLAFGESLAERFKQTPPDQPFVVHAAEGVDEDSRAEIDQLEEIGALTGRTILVHALACGDREWALLAERGCGVVWCPSSNDFLFGGTIPPQRLAAGAPVALGTDSPLTAAGGMWDELAAAHAQGVPPDALYAMATAAPARMLRLQSGAGTLDSGAPADWIALRDRGLSPCETLLDRPQLELAFVGGEPRLVSARLARERPELAAGMTAIRYEDAAYWVRADCPALLARARQALGAQISLGGVNVSEAAP